MRSVLEAAALLATEVPLAFESVLDLVRSTIPCTSVSFNDMTLATGDYRHVISPPVGDELVARLKPEYDRLVHQHPLVTEGQRRPPGTSLRFCDVENGESFAETELYTAFYEPFGLRYQLSVQLPAPPGVVVGYALNRSAAEGEFSDRDVAVLNALSPHLAMHHRHAVNSERARAVEAELDREGEWAVLTVRSDGVVSGSSSESLVSPLVRDGRLLDEIVGLLATDADGDEVDDGRKMRSHDISVGDSPWRCLVHAMPAGPSVLLVRRLTDVFDDAAPLIELGLTRRQADVAILLARTGGTNAQLAAELGISDGTVKKHLESVFGVLGVDSRAAAVAALRTVAG